MYCTIILLYLPHMGQQPSEGRAITVQFVLLVHRPILRTLAQYALTVSVGLELRHLPVMKTYIAIVTSSFPLKIFFSYSNFI